MKKTDSAMNDVFSVLLETKHIKLLLVEDHSIIVKIHQASLTNMKYNMVVAKNGLEALDFGKDKSIDIILMDIELPDMTGIEVTRKIRAKNKNVPIIAVTSHS